MAGYAVRSFENSDLQRLVEIEAASTAMLAPHGYPQLFQEEPSTPADLASVISQSDCCVAVTNDGTIAGFAYGHELGGIFWLAEMGVDPKFARRGAGSLLLAEMVRIARRYDHAAIGLTTFADVPFNAPFYARRGFLIADPAAVEPVFTEQLERQNPEGCPLSDRVLMFRRL